LPITANNSSRWRIDEALGQESHHRVAGLMRVLVAQTSPVMRLGIRTMLHAEFPSALRVDAESIAVALQSAKAHSLDLALIDLSFDRGAGFQLIRELSHAAPLLPILVFSAHDELVFAARCLEAGARGYVMHSETVERLAEAIRQLLAGRISVSEGVSQDPFSQCGDAVLRGGRTGRLTARELEVLHMIGSGVSPGAIARKLGLSTKTIDTYRSHIKTKLGLRNATELVRYATLRTAEL
jgi:DNA-binding NarL/FixJ family response regulator